jgi:hypothetical protein
MTNFNPRPLTCLCIKVGEVNDSPLFNQKLLKNGSTQNNSTFIILLISRCATIALIFAKISIYQPTVGHTWQH